LLDTLRRVSHYKGFGGFLCCGKIKNEKIYIRSGKKCYFVSIYL
jgi:hypothetical protein